MIGPRGGRGDGNQAATTQLQRRVQSAGGARSHDWAEDGGSGLSRAAAQGRPLEPLEGRLRHPRQQRVRRRRARATDRAAHCRVGALGGAALVGAGGGKKSCAALGREQKRALTAQLRGDYPVAVICRVLDLPRSNVYVHDRGSGAGPTARAEAALRFHIEQIATTWPTYGYRRVAAQLRRAAAPLAGTNSKRGRRLM